MIRQKKKFRYVTSLLSLLYVVKFKPSTENPLDKLPTLGIKHMLKRLSHYPLFEVPLFFYPEYFNVHFTIEKYAINLLFIAYCM